MRKKVKISPSKFRAILSDVLPYETPLYFSNENYFKILNRYNIELKNEKLQSALKNIPKEIQALLDLINGKENIKKEKFTYQITHKTNKERELSIIHPFDQIRLATFYNKFNKHLIYYCNKSSFSLRFPYKVATFKNSLENEQENKNDINNNDQNNLKHYFNYKKIKNINGFYKSYEYQRAEKKFNKLIKLDAKECFKNLEFKKISNAIFKVNIDECKGSMPYYFSEFMSSINSEEKKGIIIGPEFSRIFAELIYQDIDKQIEIALLKLKLIFKKDYAYYRYVDDGFLFYNDFSCRSKFESELIQQMSIYGLSLNPKKTKLIDRPFVEQITVAKEQINKLLEKTFTNNFETISGAISLNNGNNYLDQYYMNINNLIEEYKVIILNTKIEYKEVSSFTFNKIERLIKKTVKDIKLFLSDFKLAEIEKNLDKKGFELMNKYENGYINFIVECIEFIFFLFSNDKRTSNSITITRIISNTQKDLFDCNKTQECLFTQNSKNTYFKKIHDELTFVFKNNKIKKDSQVDLTSLLSIQKNQDNKFRIKPTVFENMFIDKNNTLINYLNYLSIFAILHYIENDSSYENIKIKIREWIENKVEDNSWDKKNDTETVFIILDSLTCPYLGKKWKIELLKKYQLPDEISSNLIILENKKINLFAKWYNYNTFAESRNKKSENVY